MTGPLLSLINGLGSGDWLTVLVNLVAIVVLLLIAFPVHEFAHAYVATKLGDDTPRYLGRVTLNPLAHLDIYGTLLFLLAGFGWAKPVPVNVNRLNVVGGSRTVSLAIVALAGPVSNLLLAVIFSVLYRICAPLAVDSFLMAVLARACSIAVFLNLLLALFNFIPIPPLDGSKILAAVLPDSASRVLDQIQQYGFIILVVLSISGVLNRIIIGPAIALQRLLLGN